mgnify:CR=1 FL=1
MFTLTFMDGAMPRAHQLREGETVIGRAPACDLVIAVPLMSRQHARIRVAGDHVFLRDAGSTYGTMVKGVRLTGEQELSPGDTFSVGPVTITLDREVAESAILSEKHHLFDESGTIFKRIDQLDIPPLAAAYGPAEIDKAILDALHLVVLGLNVQGKGFLVGLVERGGLQGRLLLGLCGFGSGQQAVTFAAITASSPTTRTPSVSISPSRCPSMRTVPE